MQTALLHKLDVTRGHAACNSLKTLGYGHFACVYSVEAAILPKTTIFYNVEQMAWEVTSTVRAETRAIKVAWKDPGGLMAAQAAMETQDVDPYAPRYYGIRECGDYWFGEMELLADSGNLSGHSPKTSMITGEQYARSPCAEFMATSPFLQACARRMEEQPGLGAYWDIHGQNVMLRGSQPVITDPIATTSVLSIGS